MQYLDVVLNVPINQAFTYSYDSSIVKKNTKKKIYPAAIGKRVDVRFGNRRMTGFITGIYDKLPETCCVKSGKIKNIQRIIDKEPLFTEVLLNLAKWISNYYLCSIGEAISAMLPSGKKEINASNFSYIDDISPEKEKKLSTEQIAAIIGITTAGKAIHYVYGTTGSGKTEVFLQASEKMLKEGKGVIYLVPEIGLTQQVIESVVKRFGNTVAVLHSGLTPSQKLSEWKRIMHGEARVVIGARSAVFAPVPNLGMIIIDEEHDGSYKSGTRPRYHARQVAMFRAQKENFSLIMGSATPSVEAWYMMKNQTIVTHKLTQRLAGGAIPEIKLIDLSKTKINNGCLSPTLIEEIRTTIANKRQTILFLNRRGFNHFFRCNSCGFELTCKNCSVPLTYHKAENRLRCHYCGWSIEPPHVCPKCGSIDIGYSGFGTEFIEAEVKAKFPNARILRVDTDSLKKKGDLQEKIDAFKNRNYDIMLGTQMIAKGLNFPNLQLVGIILADTTLHLPDFRASERTFSLITQVAGRAGRFFPDGKVLIQTYNPTLTPIALAAKGDADSFYKSEIKQRELLDFPPFKRLIRLVFRSASNTAAEEAATEAARICQQTISNFLKVAHLKKSMEDVVVLGPSECPIAKISLNYRYQIILRSRQIKALIMICSHLIYDYKPLQHVYIETDVDPVSLL